MFSQRLIRISSIPSLMMAFCLFFSSPAYTGGGPESEDIAGPVWKWQQTRYNNDQNAVPADPSRYTVTFNTDGTLHIQADCNRGGGSYSRRGEKITVEVTHTTRAMCPPESLEAAFIKDLNASTIFFFRDGNLYLDLKYDTGTMQFSR